jgi:hypothetical protein
MLVRADDVRHAAADHSPSPLLTEQQLLDHDAKSVPPNNTSLPESERKDAAEGKGCYLSPDGPHARTKTLDGINVYAAPRWDKWSSKPSVAVSYDRFYPKSNEYVLRFLYHKNSYTCDQIVFLRNSPMVVNIY